MIIQNNTCQYIDVLILDPIQYNVKYMSAYLFGFVLFCVILLT